MLLQEKERKSKDEICVGGWRLESILGSDMNHIDVASIYM